MNWHVVHVADGNDTEAIASAIEAGKAETQKPTMIKVSTHIAYGSPNKQDTAGAHGSPLGVEEIRLVKAFYGMPEDKDFYVPEEVLTACRRSIDLGAEKEEAWQGIFDGYRKAYPEQADAFVDAISGFLSAGWEKEIPQFKAGDDPMATRAASGKVLNAIAKNLPVLMGGSADLAPSNKTFLDGVDVFQKDAYGGRNIRFGVREHAMASIMSGMYLHSGVRPYGGTFLVFADYLRPAVRVASLMKLPLIYVLTHDSVAVGEDGPTHQPVEHLASLRAIPGLQVIRPADARETAEAWMKALMTDDAPTALLLSRQKLPILDRIGCDGDLRYGAYVLKDMDRDKDLDLILIGTGSEVHICVEAAQQLAEKGINSRVVSMPSWELFEKAPAPYKERILPGDVKARIAVEAGISMGWERYVKDGGRIIGIDRFGASAPGGKVLAEFGFTAENIVKNALELLNA